MEISVSAPMNLTNSNAATDLIIAFYQSVDAPSGNIATFDFFFAPDFKDHNRPVNAPASVQDKAVALGLFAQLRAGFPDMAHRLDIVAGIGTDTAMVYWTFTGTNAAPFFGAPASGKAVKINGVDIFRVADNCFVEQWHVEELMSLFEQIRTETTIQRC